MRRVAATGKEVRAVVGRMGSGQSVVRKGVSAKALVRRVSVAHRQQTPRYWSNGPSTRRFHLQSEPSADRITAWTWSARQAASDAGSGADTQWQVPSSGLCRVIWFNWGVRRGRREPASFAFGPSHGSREYAAIDEEVLPGDVAGLRRAQKGAGGAEFSRRAEALGGHGCHALVPCLLDRDAPVLGNPRHVRTQSFGLECAGQEEVDGDVGGGNRARDPGEKSGQTRARARGEIEARERHLHRTRGDVDDAAEFLGAHRIDDLLDALDRDHHVGDDAVDDVLTREFAKVAERRPPVVVHQNVRLRAGAESRRLACGRVDVADRGGHLGAGRLAQFRGGGIERFAVPPVDDHLAARLRERKGTGTAESAARGTDNRLAAGKSEVHG